MIREATVDSPPRSESAVLAALSKFFSPQNRYLPPLFITTILLVGHISFGVLESFSLTLVAIFTAIAFELALSWIVYKKMPILASAYITGISVGILIRSPEWWPFALTSAIAITSKYVIRWKGQHLWNPSNFGIAVMLLIAREYFATLSIQWGNAVYPMLVVWVLGAFITWRVKRFHITAVYVLSFIALSFVRSLFTGHGFLAEVAPITGPMYQLFIFFMITDPKTTVKSKKWQLIIAFLVALAEAFLRLVENVHAPYYALTIVGPISMAIDIWRRSKHPQPQAQKPAAATTAA